MVNPLKQALAEYLGRHAVGHPRLGKPPVGVSVTEAAPRFCVGLTFTYRAGARYCCAAPACLFTPDWGRLRHLLRERGLQVEPPLRVFLRCVYERGARFAVDPADPKPVYQPIEEGRTSEHIVDELDGWDPAR
jgi:hypothetical protein